ncbi:type II secretion system F family protein [Serratia marcescens]|uniref:type II secretion system F family protein n=1 Tax=Serratia marcescens TaxID=615 RepID=UPI003EE12C6E
MIAKMQRALSTCLSTLPQTYTSLERWLARVTFTTEDRLTLYEDLAFLLDNGKKLEEAIQGILETSDDVGLTFCLQDAQQALRSGLSIDIGLSAWIPLQEAAILSAGSLDGNLAAALYRAIKVVRSMGNLRMTLIKTMAYPTMLILTTFAMMKMVSDYFIPRLESAMQREKWEGALWLLANISDAFAQNILLICIFVAATLMFIFWSLPNLTGPFRKKILEHLLPWRVYKDVQGVSFLLNFSALMRAQIKTEDALTSLNRFARPWLYERLSATQERIKYGDHLGLALRNTGYDFPSKSAINKLVLLTNGDNAETVIENFAHNWLTKTVDRITRTASRLSLLCLIISALYMVLIVLGTQDLGAMSGY